MRIGEYLKAYDLACEGLKEQSDSQALQYQAVLALARTGATDQAQSKYKEFELDKVRHVDFASLEARLLKDKALICHPSKKSARFEASAKLYESVFSESAEQEFYPAINAATTYYLSGNKQQATRLATKVLEICKSTDPSYWRYASEAEALLLLGDKEAARQALVNANGHASNDMSSMGATKKQLSLICSDSEVLDALKIPRVIHYAGHIISADDTGRFPASIENKIRERIDAKLDLLGVGIGYGSLAAGADILFAEALLDRGCELHVTLPFSIEDFKKISVACSGDSWLERFETCWEKATSQSFTSEGGYQGDNSLFSYCSLYSMGRACLRQQHLAAPLSQIVIWDELRASLIAGTYSDYRAWTELGYESEVISLSSYSNPEKSKIVSNEEDQQDRELHAILFGDIRGFSGLPDNRLPEFVDVIMGCLAQTLDRLNREYDDGAVMLSNTWGDGIFVVLRDVNVAAQCAIEMQQGLKALGAEKPDLQSQAELRLGIHFGPVYELIDPVTKRINYFGEHVNRAARIEPITPPGQVYVTESFAAQLALSKNPGFKTEYVGFMPMAKNYGELPMYLLREKFDSF